MSEFKLNNWTPPTPKGVTVKAEKIWAPNTGRVASGKMVGDIVGYKLTIQVEWGILTEVQAADIDARISAAFFPVTFKNPRTNALETRIFYAGSPTYPVYSWVKGTPDYVGVVVDLIEQ